MGSPRHAAVRARPDRGRAMQRLAVALPAATVTVAVLAALAVVVPQLGDAGGVPAAAAAPADGHRAGADGVAAPVPTDVARTAAPALPTPTDIEDAAVDAAIRAAVTDQQRVQRMREEAARKAARWNERHGVTASAPPSTRGSRGTGATSGVWVVGDSIAAGLGAAWPGDPVVVAVPGAHSSTVVPHAAPALAAASGRPLTVVALGTNDNPTQPELFRSEVRTLLAAAPGCVVWTTIHQPGGRWEVLNSVLRDEAARSGGRLQLADWDRLATSAPELLQSDGIHPRTGTVYSSIVALAQQAASRCP